jgi:hypothetical protein
MSDDKFWIDDPTVLYKNGNYLQVIPDSSMTRIQQLNAITRLCIYFIIILLLFGKAGSWLYVPLIIIVLIVILYNIYVSDPYDTQKANKEHFIPDDFDYNEDIETGHYDSNGDLLLNREYGPFKVINKRYTDEDPLNKQCKEPTKDNPFMNPEIVEYNTDDPPVACNADDEEIKDQLEERFNENLFMDIEDLWGLKNSQRQFYTVPIPAIPNDQTEFANWLYKTELTCKEDQEQCLRFEPLQFKRHI